MSTHENSLSLPVQALSLRTTPPRMTSLLTTLLLVGAFTLLFAGCADKGTESSADQDLTDSNDLGADLPSDTPTDGPDLPDIPDDIPAVDTDNDCIFDALESATGTDPNDADSDDDGLPDGVEDANCDGLLQDGETNPRNPDSDGDTLSDGDEDTNKNGTIDPGETDPNDADSDDDGLDDNIETGCSDPNNPDSDDDGLPDGIEDASGNGAFDPERGETDLCDEDTDGDNLVDGCEDTSGDGARDASETDPTNEDTDGDGVFDGSECTGAVPNTCPNFDFAADCASDPRSADTDGDGLIDTIELASNYRNGATDPRNPDTDGDTIPDGLEDLNQDGDWDDGELDPTTPETYPGEQDADNPIGQTCRTDQLRPIQHAVDGQGDWNYIVSPNFLPSVLTIANNTNPYRAAVALDDNTDNVSVFVVSKTPELGTTDAATELDAIETKLGGLTPFFPRSFDTWDGFGARTARYTLSGGSSTRTLRNQLIAQLVDAPLSEIGGLPGAGGGVASRYELVLTTVYRAPQRVIVLGAITPVDTPIPSALRVKLNNLTNATGLAQAVDNTLAQCELFVVTRLPIADFIFVVDDTSSMQEEQDAVTMAANDIFDAINNSLLDARWTVASTELENTSGVGPANICGMLNNPRGPGGSIWSGFSNGDKLDFLCRIKDPGGIQSCDPPPDNFFGGREYALGCAELAVDYVQGRNTAAGVAPAANRQQTDGALVVITLSDEDDYIVTGGSMTATQAADHYETFFEVTASSVPNLGPTIPFAISRHDGCCSLFDELFRALPPRLPDSAAQSIDDLAGIPLFIDQIVQAAGGFASIFRPQNAPITFSMKVVVQDVGGVREVSQSLDNGWDYDPITNGMLFYGSQRPQIGDDIALSYRYWEKLCPVPTGCSMQ